MGEVGRGGGVRTRCFVSHLLVALLLAGCTDVSDSDIDGKMGEETGASDSGAPDSIDTSGDTADSDTAADTGDTGQGRRDVDGDGYFENDCDDGNAEVNPGAIEVCDDVDNDCDGDVDGGSVDASTWFEDADGDGYGDTSSTKLSCDSPPDFVADNADCDDGDGAVNPAATEVCENGVDDDCDGAFAGCLGSGSLAGADAQYTGETAGDKAGSSVSTAGDVNGDGFGDLLIAGPGNPSGGGPSAGAAYLVLGSATPGDLDLGAADARYTGEAANDFAGSSVSTAGDVDGDGFGDLLIGAMNNADGGSSAGAAYLVLGSATPGDLDLGAADAQYTGTDAGDEAGCSVSTAGDVNGDGFGDLLIGAFYNDDGGADAGSAYLVLGSATPGNLGLGAADAQYTGEAAGDFAGYTVSAAGDVEGDGFGDILIVAIYDATGLSGAGSAYLVLGSTAPADLGLGAADAQYTGEAAFDYAGFGVASAGDVEGDGFGDLIIGAYGNDDGGSLAGAAYLILGTGL